ncbi:unnamed protein product [Clonostachys chloroleuca]|uniref:Methyltransferase domain-containing protein n=1 Tax=Clonostachys chloroleuca TaxID=1926264 RepID=A0AA35M327_9HYPO|nr:unnamed protein product [Clonostachys chloroleuca]
MALSSSVYILNAATPTLEQERLDFQHHHLFKPLAGKLVPEHILIHLQARSEPKVADLATGTGLWLQELASQLPSDATLDGYDYDVSKFRATETLPANVRLGFGDVLKPFSSELHGRYDLVHLRLLMYALKADQWAKVCENVLTLLKPGGWLLWGETGYPMWQCFPISPAWNQYLDIEMRGAGMLGRDVAVPLRLLQQVRDAGFVDCDDKHFSSISVTGLEKRMTQLMRAISFQSLRGLVEKGGVEGMRTHDEAERLTRAIMEDMKSREANCGMTWVWGLGAG